MRPYQDSADHPRTNGRRTGPTFNMRPVKRPPESHVVYFVRADNGLIKIGTTRNVEWRLKGMRGQSPLSLTLLATTPGKRAQEYEYHARFAEHRQHGEWFAPHPDLLAEIARLASLQGEA